MFNEEEKNQAIGYFERLIKKTYTSKVNDSRIDNQYINMSEIIRYYDNAYGTDFQNNTLSSLPKTSYDKFVNLLLHERDDDKGKVEGQNIKSEEIKRTTSEQIDKSKMPSNTIDKSQIMLELKKMAEDEKDITESDVSEFVISVTIMAINMATLKKYEKNREQIRKHTDITRVRNGEFALEDRLATENRQYEVYLQKLAKQYQAINPNHKLIQSYSKVAGKEKEIRDEHNKEQGIKENKREVQIDRINSLYAAKEATEEEMAQMSANPAIFNKAKFEELKDRLFGIDKDLAERPGPATLIENIERDQKQEIQDEKSLGKDGKQIKSVASTSVQNEYIETRNDQKIVEGVKESIENSSKNIDEVINRYYECRNSGDLKGAKEQYKILMTLNGSKESLENQIDEVSKKHGNEEYHTENEKDDNLKEELGLNAVNDDREIAEFDSMDYAVERVSRENGAETRSSYQQRNEVSQNEPKQHTLFGNKNPH